MTISVLEDLKCLFDSFQILMYDVHVLIYPAEIK